MIDGQIQRQVENSIALFDERVLSVAFFRQMFVEDGFNFIANGLPVLGDAVPVLDEDNGFLLGSGV